MLHRSTVQIDGCTIYYRRSEGQGPPLLFIPGGVVDHADLTWKSTIRRAAAAHEVWAPDLPGFGRSRGLPTRPYGTAYVTDFIRAFIRHFELNRPVLLANSMSAAAGLEMALNHPDEIRSLVVSGAYGLRGRVAMHSFFHALAHTPRMDRIMRRLMRVPGVVRLGIRLLVQKPSALTPELLKDGKVGAAAPEAPTAFVHWLRDEMRPDSVKSDYRSELSRIRIPVLILQGRYDWLAPAEDARLAARQIPGATYREFETRHLIPREEPDAVCDAIFSFIEHSSYTET